MMLFDLCVQILFGRLERRMVLNLVYVVMTLTFLFQAIDWLTLRAALQDLTPLAMAQTSAVCIGGFALLSAPLIRTVLFGPHMAWVLRQPISGVQWSLTLIPMLMLAGAPLLLLPILQGTAHPLLRMAMWMLVWPPVAVSVAGGSVRASLATIGAAALTLTGGPLFAPLALIGSVLTTGPLFMWLARRTPRWALPALSWRPRRPWSAVVTRDLLCLIRTEPRTLAWGLIPTMLAGGLLFNMMDKQTFDDAGLEDSAAVTLAIAASGAGLAMAALSERLGRQLTPRRWPISALGRAVTLSAVAAVTASPAWAAMSIVSAPSAAPTLCAEWIALSVGAALIAYRSRLSRPSNLGVYGLWSCVTATLAALIWPTNLLLAAAGMAWLTWRIQWHNRG
ncbi:MAG: hypothetical protein AAFV53_37540 [Myxococcota bacterium]